MYGRGGKMLNVKKYYTSFCKLSRFLYQSCFCGSYSSVQGPQLLLISSQQKRYIVYQGQAFYRTASFWGEISFQAQIWKPGKCLRYEAYKVFRWSKSPRALSDDEVLDKLPTSGLATNCWVNLLWQLKRQRFFLSPWLQDFLHFE